MMKHKIKIQIKKYLLFLALSNRFDEISELNDFICVKVFKTREYEPWVESTQFIIEIAAVKWNESVRCEQKDDVT
jgi:hypothetical protein